MSLEILILKLLDEKCQQEIAHLETLNSIHQPGGLDNTTLLDQINKLLPETQGILKLSDVEQATQKLLNEGRITRIGRNYILPKYDLRPTQYKENANEI